MSLQEAGDGLESIIEFQVQIKGHNQREYEDKWQGWQNWTDEKLATKLTKDDQQPVLLLLARWCPDTLLEFKSGGWWQRPHKRVRCRQCKCSLAENPSFKSSKCHLIEMVLLCRFLHARLVPAEAEGHQWPVVWKARPTAFAVLPVQDHFC